MKLALALWAFIMMASPAFAVVDTVVGVDGQVYYTGFLKSPPSADALYFSPSAEMIKDVPDVYDSRQDHFVSPIKNQGSCGSCWAFSITKALESVRLLAGKTFSDLAEQDPLSMDKTNYGCQGGYMNATYWVNHGIALTKDCPYMADDSVKCHAKAFDHGTAWGFVGAKGRAPTEDELKAAIYKYKVISITVAAGGIDWQGGNGGQMTSCGNTGINHMVNLVGYKCGRAAEGFLDANLGDDAMLHHCVFTGANSWGKKWGDNGFFYARQGCNQMASDANSALFVSYKK